MIEVIPALIPETFDDIAKYARQVRGAVSRIQIDVSEGRYTPTRSWPYNKRDGEVWQKVQNGAQGLPFWEDFLYEVDLMVKEPEVHVDHWIQAGAATLIVHVESTLKIGDIMERAKAQDTEVALALRPSTDVSVLEPWVAELAFVQLMGSDAIGRHGVALDEARVLPKLCILRKRYPNLSLGVDIGVSEETAPLLVKAGATRLATFSALFKGGKPKDVIDYLQGLDG